MKVGDLKTSLVDYFFKPVSPYPLAVFRILFGACACATLLLLHGDWGNWFGVHSWITMNTIAEAETGFRLNLFAIIPQDDRWIDSLYWIMLLASITLTLGVFTRVSSIITFLGLNSLNQRLPLILHGGDVFLRSAGFFLMFASSGNVLSLDAVIRRLRNSSDAKSSLLVSPWPQRLIQYQLAIVYLASFWWKAQGNSWLDGTALFYVLHLREIRRFEIPHFFYDVWMLKLGTWTAMAFELLFPFLVWFRSFRNPILLAGLLFHLSIEYALNVPMFGWDILSAYVLFLDFGSRESFRPDQYWLLRGVRKLGAQ